MSTTASPSRRTVLHAAAWTAPVIVAAGAAPAWAASTDVTGFLDATRAARAEMEFGDTVTNNRTTATTVTITWLHTCDSGRFTQGTYRSDGWTVSTAVREAVDGNPERRIRLVASRSVPARQTVALPYLAGILSADGITGTSGAVLAVGAPAGATQPTPVRWPTTVGTTAPARRGVEDGFVTF